MSRAEPRDLGDQQQVTRKILKHGMAKIHVAVLGDAFCDIVAGPLTAMPRWGSDLECPHISQLAGGSALNVAVHLGALCASNESRTCSFHGLVGNDPFGGFLRQRLAEVGVSDEMESSEAGTGVCIVLSGLDDRGFVTQVSATGSLPESIQREH